MIKFLYKLSLTPFIILGLYCCNTVKSDESDHTSNLSDTLSKISNTTSTDSADSNYESTLVDNQPEEDNINSISEIYKRNRKKASVFMVNPNRDTVLKCKEGTLISIPANSFERVNNQSLVDGNIKLSVKEYYSISDILLANLTTRSGDQMIETGGMFSISAYAKDNNDSLSIKKDKKITIALPTSETRNMEGMQLFNGVHDSSEVNWKPVPGKAGFAQRWWAGKSKPEYDFDNSFIFPDIEPKKTPTLTNSKQTYQTELLIPVRDAIQNNNGVTRSALGYIDTLGVLHGYFSGYKKNKFKFETDYSHTVSEDVNVNVAVTFKVRMSLKNNVNTRYFDKLFKMGKGNPDSLVAVILTYTHNIKKTNYENIKPVYKNNAITVSIYKNRLKEIKRGELAYEKQIKQLEASPLANINSAQQYLLLSTQKLGWINCDRFYNYTNKTDYIVKLNEKMNVLLVFNAIKSVISSDNQGVFRNVPLGEKITIVALKADHGKIMLAIHETQISEKPFENLQFKAVSINEYKSKLKTLNSI
jgi:hypothetical protein